MHKRYSRALCATTALATGLLFASAALAQSTTGSATVEELVVTGATGPQSLGGIVEQTAPKTRTVIDQDFITKQMAGQTIADTLNVVPGYNFTNNDPYGNSGGNIRLRSFDCARISLQWDGIQVNDSGNYACYSNQLGDSETISMADVAQGTTDVDTPSASATGGAINYRTRLPKKEFGGFTNLSGGSDNYVRAFGLVDSGEIGPWGTRLFVAGSYTNYDKFRGKGELDKRQFNARIYQPIGDKGDFASLAFHWNRNRNNAYNSITLPLYAANGYNFDNDYACTRLAPGAGTVQDENKNTITDYNGNVKTGSCTNYYNLRINPSDTGNIRGQFKYHLTDNLIFTADPSFQYTLANGGGFTLLSETDAKLKGAAGASGKGVDLNGDGDTLDTVTTYSPSNTNTRRYGLNSSLIWNINADHRLRLAYAFDMARHRQTGEYTYVDQFGNPFDVFGGKDGHGPKIMTADGSFVRSRDRFSIASLNMVAAEYVGHFLDNSVEVRAGVRAPFLKRELNQFCYSQDKSSTVLCTTAPVATTLANGNVTFAGSSTQYIKPYKAERKYDAVLPNVGVSYRFLSDHSVYVSYAEGLSAPRTDNLYTVSRAADGSIVNPGVQPETTQTYEAGYRFSRRNVQATVAVYDSKFQNRIVTSYDQELGYSIDRNIGDAEIKGVDFGIALRITDKLTYIGNASHVDAKVLSDTPQAAGPVPTTGKKLVETPENQWFQRLEWSPIEKLSVGVQGKWVAKRFSTDVNDEEIPSYQTWDLDVRWKLPEVLNDRTYVQVNVKNLFDERYLGSIPTTSASALGLKNAAGQTIVGASAPRYQLGAPRTVQVTLHTEF